MRCVPRDVERGEPVCSEHLSGGEGAVARFFSPLDLPSGRLEESLLFPEVYVEVPRRGGVSWYSALWSRVCLPKQTRKEKESKCSIVTYYLSASLANQGTL